MRGGNSSTSHFVKESGWRDLLCMTWDFRTLQGPEQIGRFIANVSKLGQIADISLDRSANHKFPHATKLGELDIVQAFLKVETNIGRGEGFVRLVLESNKNPQFHDGEWKCFTLFTTLKELKGHEERICRRRPTGLGGNGEGRDQNWKDRLIAQRNFEGGKEPTVMIIGMTERGQRLFDRFG